MRENERRENIRRAKINGIKVFYFFIGMCPPSTILFALISCFPKGQDHEKYKGYLFEFQFDRFRVCCSHFIHDFLTDFESSFFSCSFRQNEQTIKKSKIKIKFRYTSKRKSQTKPSATKH